MSCSAMMYARSGPVDELRKRAPKSALTSLLPHRPVKGIIYRGHTLHATTSATTTSLQLDIQHSTISSASSPSRRSCALSHKPEVDLQSSNSHICESGKTSLAPKVL